jgi:uncharacterized protein
LTVSSTPATETPSLVTQARVERAASLLRENAPLLIAFSGGVDSAYLLALAHRVCGDSVRGFIADSPSLPRRALEDALALAERIGAKVEVMQTGELENPDYSTNPVNRCYFCKAELFVRMESMAAERGFKAIAYGENADDAAQFRPGAKAAAEFKVIAPLKAAGLTKAEIRALSRAMKLPTADAPAQPCLSSRIPHGTPVTAQHLAMIEAAEEVVRELGFRVFRVRHIVDGNGLLTAPASGEKPPHLAARLQVAPEEMHILSEELPTIRRSLSAIGYDLVEVDPAGYRSPAPAA